MYHKHAWAPYFERGKEKFALMQSHFRAPVNVYKTDNSYEVLVFAPGRIKENFRVKTQGNELTVSYTPPEGLPRPNWILLFAIYKFISPANFENWLYRR